MRKHLATAGLALGSVLLVGTVAAAGSESYHARIAAEQVAARDAETAKNKEIYKLEQTLQASDKRIGTLKTECEKGARAYAVSVPTQRVANKLQAPAC